MKSKVLGIKKLIQLFEQTFSLNMEHRTDFVPVDYLKSAFEVKDIAPLYKDDPHVTQKSRMVRIEPYSPPELQIHHIPKKGLGVIAHSSVPPGEIIVEEEPMVSLPLNADGSLDGNFRRVDFVNEDFYSPYLEQALRRLPMETRALFHSLSDATSPGRIGKSNFGIIKTNSFAIAVNSRTYLGLFPNVARINHSCIPNLSPLLDIENWEIYSAEDFHSRDSRQKILYEEFGFYCECRSCLDWSESEDENRYTIRNIEKCWKDYASDPEMALKQAERQWELAIKLNFHCGHLSYICLHAVEASTIIMENASGSSTPSDSYLRSKDSALYFSDQGLSAGELAYGRDSSEYKIFHNIYDEVRSEKASSTIAKSIRRYLNQLKND
ncbi:unnamed protein product [Lepeophtheirus salmonis]|uniref:(salmon louse) hypothetical protein n=1 Tax=Lepeophtheirus salmonis TaxID=72036 RepID=A0A7R8D3N9_LEPSM|nr:unnamed protein product [Lepeophtheirus salmonis]CAF3018414.1 unnamed protein product [Lepeophtheirus salmonis]